MKSLDIDFLHQQVIPIEMGGLLQKLGEYKGRQDLFQRLFLIFCVFILLAMVMAGCRGF